MNQNVNGKEKYPTRPTKLQINKMKTRHCICNYIPYFMHMLTELNHCWVTHVIGDNGKVKLGRNGCLVRGEKT